MYYPVLIAACEILALFFLARTLTKTLSALIHSFTGSTRSIVYGIAFLFLPGTLIHELAHFFMAKLLFVYAGEISLLPKLEGEMLKMGSVQIGKTDPLRKLLIGIAPLIVGTTILFTMYYFFSQQHLSYQSWQIYLSLFVTFEIANTMFSSRKDMEGTFILFAILIFIIVLCFIFKLYPPSWTLSAISNVLSLPFFHRLSMFLLVPLIIDVLLIGGVKIFVR